MVAIADGDTATVLHDNEQVRVRLAEIDAPEKKQPFGTRSQQSLAELVFGKTVTVREAGKDRYGRTIGYLIFDGTNANTEQIRRGMAWVYDRYVTDRTLYAHQDKAKNSRTGLWADASPIPPWEWRKGSR